MEFKAEDITIDNYFEPMTNKSAYSSSMTNIFRNYMCQTFIKENEPNTLVTSLDYNYKKFSYNPMIYHVKININNIFNKNIKSKILLNFLSKVKVCERIELVIPRSENSSSIYLSLTYNDYHKVCNYFNKGSFLRNFDVELKNNKCKNVVLSIYTSKYDINCFGKPKFTFPDEVHEKDKIYNNITYDLGFKNVEYSEIDDLTYKLMSLINIRKYKVYETENNKITLAFFTNENFNDRYKKDYLEIEIPKEFEEFCEIRETKREDFIQLEKNVKNYIKNNYTYAKTLIKNEYKKFDIIESSEVVDEPVKQKFKIVNEVTEYPNLPKMQNIGLTSSSRSYVSVASSSMNDNQPTISLDNNGVIDSKNEFINNKNIENENIDKIISTLQNMKNNNNNVESIMNLILDENKKLIKENKILQEKCDKYKNIFKTLDTI